MRFRAYLLATEISLLTLSGMTFGQIPRPIPNTSAQPFEVAIFNGNYGMTHGTSIVLTNTELTITSRDYINLKDSLLFSKILFPSDTLSRITQLVLPDLKSSYINPCVAGRSNIIITQVKDGMQKKIWVSGYFQQDVGNLICLINMLLPEKYKVWYDKKELEAQNCTGYARGEAINLFDSASGNFLRLDSNHTTVSAVDKNGLILWKTDLNDSLLEYHEVLMRGNSPVPLKENGIKMRERPEVNYYGLTKGNKNFWCRSPEGSSILEIGFGMVSVGLDVKNGKVVCRAQD